MLQLSLQHIYFAIHLILYYTHAVCVLFCLISCAYIIHSIILKYNTLVLSTCTTQLQQQLCVYAYMSVSASVSVNVTVRGCVRGKRKLRDEVKSLRHSAALQNTHHGRKAEQEH